MAGCGCGCNNENILIDGCPVSCGKKTFENHKLPYRHFIMTDYDVEEGKTEITEIRNSYHSKHNNYWITTMLTND